jgi:hypothetical protein
MADDILANGGAPTPRPATTPPLVRRIVVVTPTLDRGNSGNVVVALVAAAASVVAHAVLILLMMNVNVGVVSAGATATDVETETRIEEPQPEESDLTNPDIGLDSSLPTAYNVETIKEISVPGPADPTAATGILNAPEAAPFTVPPPPGAGGGTGAAPILAEAGTGALFGTEGGYGGLYNGGGFKGRSGATRTRLLQEGGGNARSEAAVARGLEWLALHQAQGGFWSLDGFIRHAREKPYPEGKNFADDSNTQGSIRNDVAGTAFALLPFLAAGQTHKPPLAVRDDPSKEVSERRGMADGPKLAKELRDRRPPDDAPPGASGGKDSKRPQQRDYHRGIDAGLKFLIHKQGKDGYYGGGMYAHCLASIAMCEAFGLTSDPVLRVSAQKAVNYIVDAQDPSGGGWRYSPREPGDTSVTGWALMALKSGQMGGLSVPSNTLHKVERFLDSVEAPKKGGYRYLPGQDEKRAMTAVGMLCRLYLEVNPRNPTLLAGVGLLKEQPPARDGDLYYEYYATQVMHHIGGESWDFWNKGPDGKSGIRDTLIAAQDQGTSGRKGNAGSWAPTPDFGTQRGGRLMATSLSLLTLEVYYRHLPLYRRYTDLAKDAK